MSYHFPLSTSGRTEHSLRFSLTISHPLSYAAEVGIKHHKQPLQLLFLILAERVDELGTFRSRQAIEHLLDEEQFHDALHKMRVIRCDLMEELHRSQRRVDCLDFLIRQTEKEIKMSTERR